MSALRPQYVNLYQRPAGSEFGRYLRAGPVAQAAALLAGGLVLLTVFASWRVGRAEASAEAIAAQLRLRDDALLEAGARYASAPQFRALQGRVERWARRIAGQDVVLSRLEHTTLGARDGFRGELAAIARARIDGVWITRIELTAAPAGLRLSGMAATAELLPRYLESLGAQRGLPVRELETLVVESEDERGGAARERPASGPVRFVVARDAKDSGGAT